MNETTPFFQSWGFWLCLGLVIGAVVGFFTAALCAISGQASRTEEMYEALRKESLRQGFEPGGFIGPAPITKGTPDKE